MSFNFDNKSLFIGIAAGFSVAILVLSLILLALKNQELSSNNVALQKELELQKIEDIPLKKVKETSYPDHNTIVYEEFPKHDEAKDDKEHLTAQEEPAAQADLAPKAEKKEVDASAPMYVKNKQAITIDPAKKQIAIVIDDLGVHVENSRYSAEQLPKEVTFSYLPYGRITQELIKQEFNKNREAMLHLPTEPVSSIDPGPNALYANMSKEKIESLTYYNLNQVLDYVVGANNHMGSKFTANLKDMEYVLKILDENKLFFMDSFTTAKTKVKEARNNVAPNLPLLKRNIFLDHKRTNEFITSQLAKVENVANKRGYAIAIGHPHKITTDVLVKWSKTLEKKGFQLVPITAILELEQKKLAQAK